MVNNNNSFSGKQKIALALAQGPAKMALRRTYEMQNAVTGSNRKPAVRKRVTAQQVAFRMQPGSVGQRGQPLEVKHYWDQTPASSNVMAPRGFGYYDAFRHTPSTVLTAFSIGPATPIQATTVFSVETSRPYPWDDDRNPLYVKGEGGTRMLIIYPARDNTQAVLLQLPTKNFGTDAAPNPKFQTSALVDYHYYNSPQLETDAPQSAMPARCSARVRNYTESLAVGGLVRVLRVTTGFDIGNATEEGKNKDAAWFAAQCTAIRNHERTRTYDAAELRETMQKNCTVVDSTRSTTFNQFAATPIESEMLDPTFTPIVFLFEPFASTLGPQLLSGGGNVYEFNLCTQFLAHYRQGTMLANMAIDPRSDVALHNKHKNEEERKGSTLESVANVISHVGRVAWDHRREIMGVAKKVAPYVLAA